MVLIAAVLLAACNTNTRTRAEVASQVDTSGLAEFQAWKKQQEFMQQVAAYQMAMGNMAVQQQPATVSSARKTSSGAETIKQDTGSCFILWRNVTG